MAAMRMPSRTPKKTTPAVATRDRSSAVLRTCAKRRRTAMSASETAAMMTTAASAVWGRSLSRPGTTTSMRATRPAPTRLATCVLAPDCSATAVRELLTEMAKPWNRPAPTLEAPTAIISRSAFTSSPRRAAKVDEVAMVSVSETRTMPTAAAASVARSLAAGPRERRDRAGPSAASRPCPRPCRRGPRRPRRPWRRPRRRGSPGSSSRVRGRPNRRASVPRPSEERGRVRLVEVREEGDDVVDEGVRVGREAEELGELADDDRDGQPVHVADLDLLGEQVGDEPQLAEPRGRSR